MDKKKKSNKEPTNVVSIDSYKKKKKDKAVLLLAKNLTKHLERDDE